MRMTPGGQPYEFAFDCCLPWRRGAMLSLLDRALGRKLRNFSLTSGFFRMIWLESDK